MRFNVAAAIVLGTLLPVLETTRRGFAFWFENFTTMFEDYLAGAALVICGIGVLRGRRWAPMSLLIVWSGVTFMMFISTVSQIERHYWGVTPEPRSGVVLIAKVMLLAVCVVALAQSARDCKEGGSA